MLASTALLLLACTPHVGDTHDLPGDSAADTAADSSPPTDTGPVGDTQAPVLPPVLVNELMSNNDSAVQTEEGTFPDWFELYNAGDEDVDLGGYHLSDDWTEKDKASITDGTILEPGAYLLFWADDSDQEGHVPFKLDSQGESLGLFDPDGNSVDWVGYSAQREDYAWARIPDGGPDWVEVAHGTPGAANTNLQEETTVLVDKGATWAYLDSGEDPGEDWTSLDFDDSGWATGEAPLGYGDSQTTQVSYGDDSSNKHPTTWFRHRFELAEGLLDDAEGVELLLRVDDGCVVWLNGAELTRLRMADGDISSDDYAADTAAGDDETSYNGTSHATKVVLEGENVLAVEVHQTNATSSDITLDLELSLERWVETH